MTRHEIGKEYHERTEAFDRSICTGPIIRGEIMPNGGYELFEINRHAREVRNELRQKGLQSSYSIAEVDDAIRQYKKEFRAKMGFDKQSEDPPGNPLEADMR